MSEPVKKRKAQDQLSPYTQDLPTEDAEDSLRLEKGQRPQRKARARRGDSLDKPSLKGIFGNVSLADETKISEKTEKDEMVAGLNSSFLKAIQIVVEKQSNKDLRYLFEQYSSFFSDIERNCK